MPQGTVEFNCKICRTPIRIPWGRPLSAVETQCKFGCYEIYPGVLSWDAKQKKLRVLRTEAVRLLSRYRTYDRLVAECRAILVGETIHASLTIGKDESPVDPTPSKKKITTKV